MASRSWAGRPHGVTVVTPVSNNWEGEEEESWSQRDWGRGSCLPPA